MAKKSKTPNAKTDLVIPASDCDNALIKRYLKEKAERAERETIAAKVPQLLKAASELFEKDFATASALFRFINPKKGKKASKRGARITPQQKDEVKKLRKDGKTDAEIASSLGLQETQVKRVK